MEIKLIRIKVEGRVQGVWFRKYTAMKAKELNINGFVKNDRDQSVYIEATGDQKDLQLFLNWLAIGSPLSNVRSVNYEEGELKEFQSFKIEV